MTEPDDIAAGREGLPDGEPGTPRPFGNERVLDAAAMKALAHPLRVTLMDLLQEEGPATASMLGRSLGETSGATSYHLRQLERHGFVVDDPDLGTGRERWWRRVSQGITLRGVDFMADPETRGDVSVLLSELQRSKNDRLLRWQADAPNYPRKWVDNSTESESRTRLTAEEMGALRDELWTVMVRHIEIAEAREPDPEETLVTVQLAVFPLRRPGEHPADGETDDAGHDEPSEASGSDPA